MISKKIRIEHLPQLKPSFYSALSGNVGQALAMVQALDVRSLSELEKDFADRFKLRFENDYQNQRAVKSWIDELISIFERYWHDGLKAQKNPDQNTARFLCDLLKLAIVQGFKCPDTVPSFDQLAEFFRTQLSRAGYESIFWLVKPFFSLMIWQKEHKETYQVQLTDKEQAVDVVFMENFLSLGWAAYATLDVLHVAGWANKHGLRCVKFCYDLSSENFKISYLAHEARHFADIILYPDITPLSLEYRAKLTELALAQTTLAEIVDKFFYEQKNDPELPHPHASYLLMSRMSSKLNIANCADAFKALDVDKLRNQASELLVQDPF